MSLYFSYGSNMNKAQMETRCPGSQFIAAVRLDNYRFVYDGYTEYRKGPVGNIVPDAGNSVWGALYEVSDENMLKLDAIEMSAMDYQKSADFVVHGTDGQEYVGVAAYIRPPQKEGTPTDDYRNTILQGAADCGLSKEYIKKAL